MQRHLVDEFWCINVDSTAWSKVLHRGTRREFKKGEQIVSAGELVTQLRYLESGSVCMKRTTLDGNEKILMHIERSSLFCEVPFFTGDEIHSSFNCHRDAVVYCFSKEVVDDILEMYPCIAKDIIRTLSMKVIVLSNQIASLGLDTLEQRIAKFILLRYNLMNLADADLMTLGTLRMKDVASILGVHRATLYRALKTMEKMRLIKLLNENRLQVLNIEALAALANH